MSQPSPSSPAPTLSRKRVFFTRLSSTLGLWAVMGTGIWMGNTTVVLTVAVLLGLAGSWEYAKLTRDDEQPGFARWGLLLSTAYWVATLVWYARHGEALPFAADLLLLAIGTQGAFLLCYQHQLEGAATLRRIFTVLFGWVYTVLLYAFLPRIICLPALGEALPPNGIMLLLFVVMVTKFTDMGAYAFGVLWGRRKMIPHISPAKTWEGLGGAFVGAFLAASCMMALAGENLAPLTWTHVLILAPVLCLLGVTGDLAESVIKRCIAIKDTGHAFPGIGGILDLTDSLLFTGPVFYFYLEFLRRA
ncbi:MAG: phosphatidate cytidylyltransferase [Verrucomicrobiales bacterium]|nr:phosphatidate cytidylyltransferase [Verrucomicrobiales bacterium]